MTVSAQEVIKFWFEDIEPKFWFKKDNSFDELLRKRFFETQRAAARAELYQWRETAEGRLAEVIVLDQFSRNLYRQSAEAFASDALALALSQEAIASQSDRELTPEQRTFLYMPFMHSESLVIHDIAVQLFTELGREQNLEYEYKHKAIIERFGRYPHRNEVLGRSSTDEELAFLKQPGSSF